ncbi:MAG: hypothetical protein Q9M18_00740 [Mariprofundaceae bacterium]|nr:hypothetical protein [Mariprofundaceae bacterium]
MSLSQPSIGTPLSATATRVLGLGSGELGKEVALELQGLGVEIIAEAKAKRVGESIEITL